MDFCCGMVIRRMPKARDCTYDMTHTLHLIGMYPTYSFTSRQWIPSIHTSIPKFGSNNFGSHTAHLPVARVGRCTLHRPRHAGNTRTQTKPSSCPSPSCPSPSTSLAALFSFFIVSVAKKSFVFSSLFSPTIHLLFYRCRLL